MSVSLEQPAGQWQTVLVGDTEIGFVDRGDGDPVFLVHAGVFSEWFRDVGSSRALEDFRVIRLRRAGYGGMRPATHLTIADHARDVAAVADHLGLDRIHFVGHSSSCQIGLALALQRPELLESLTLLEPAAAGGFDVPASVAVRGPAGAAMAAFERGELEIAFDLFMRGVCGDGYRDVIVERLGEAGLDAAVRESEFFFRDEGAAVLESSFGAAEGARILQPVLCVEGGAQPAHLTEMSRQISERVARLLPQAEVAVIPGVGHAMPLEAPDAVAEMIAAFVRRREAA